jgi:hypothetical protein
MGKLSRIDTMKKLLIATMLLAFVPVAAGAEEHAPPTARTDKEKKQDAEIEKAYQDAVKRERASLPKTKADPWGGIRSSGNDTTANH